MYSHDVKIKNIVLHCYRRYVSLWIYSGAALLFFLFCIFTLFFTAPLEDVYYPQVFSVPKGGTVRGVAEDLRKRKIISSPSLFIFSNRIIGEKIVWGSYHFARPSSVFFRAQNLYAGAKDMPSFKIVIPERSNAYHIADIFREKINGFSQTEFLELALERHGYLYPDTYFFSYSYVSPDHLIETMTRNFERQTNDLFSSYEGNLSKNELITLASIVELEASRFEDRRAIAGVLFNRLELHMPLQVDVSFLFISDKNTFNLTKNDLESNNPSNTYRYAGIPPIPITNPGRASIKAVINPLKSDNLYFLADFRGNTHYSKTYAEHLAKRAKYIGSIHNRNKPSTTANASAPNEQKPNDTVDTADSAKEESDTVDGEEGGTTEDQKNADEKNADSGDTSVTDTGDESVDIETDKDANTVDGTGVTDESIDSDTDEDTEDSSVDTTENENTERDTDEDTDNSDVSPASQVNSSAVLVVP